MGGASPTFKYDYVAHVSAHIRPFPSLLLGYEVASSPGSSQFINVARTRVFLRATLKNWEEPGDEVTFFEHSLPVADSIAQYWFKFQWRAY